jgi:hypothetical protein
LKAHIDAPLPPYDPGRGALVVGSGHRIAPVHVSSGASGHGAASNLGVWAADRRCCVSGAPGDRAPA